MIETAPVMRFQDEHGRNFLARTQGDYYRFLRSLGEIRAVPEEQERYLDTLRFDPDAFDQRFDELWEPEYELEPVDYETFVTNPYFLGAAMNLYPRLIEEGIRIFHARHEYAEIIYTGGIGWGKSYHAVSILAYDLHRLLCMKSHSACWGWPITGICTLSIWESRRGRRRKCSSQRPGISSWPRLISGTNL